MGRFRSIRFLALVVAGLCFGLSTGTAAQTLVPESSAPSQVRLQDLSAEERAELLARLTDAEVRELFLSYVEEVSPAAGAAAERDPIERLDEAMGAARSRLAAVLGRSGELYQVPGFLIEHANAGLGSRHFYLVVTIFILLAIAGYGGERLYKRSVAGAYERLSEHAGGADEPALAGRFLGRLALDAIGILVFAAVILVLFFVLYRGHEPTRLLVGALFTALLAARLGIALLRAVMAPRNAALRLLPLNDDDAARLFRWSVATVVFGALWLSLGDLLRDFGIDRELFLLLQLIGGSVLLALVLVCLAMARKPVGEALAAKVSIERRETNLCQAAARQWHLLPMLYVAAVYAVSVASGLLGAGFGSHAGLWSLLIIAFYPLADFIVAALVRGFFGAEDTQRAVVAPIFVRAARIVVLLAAILLFFSAWGIEIFAVGGEAILGGQLASAVLQIGATILVAYLLWGIAKLACLRYVGEATEDAGADEGAPAAAATRLQTIMPLLLRFFQITLIAMVVMILLSSMGVDIGPLLAGAGVVGIAIGFGAQTLVRDVVSGLFFLLDDAFRKGEYVDIGSVKGTVENINVRSLVLRHHLGPIHTVPFGEIQHLTNFSRDWVIMKLEFRVPTDTDLQKVKKIFKKIGAEMLEHPELGEDFIQPFKSQGVKAIEDSAIIVRGKFMSKPGRQFQIRKELYNRVQAEFQAAGIEFAHRKVTVELPPEVKLSDEQKQKVAEAAGAAARGIEEPQSEPSR